MIYSGKILSLSFGERYYNGDPISPPGGRHPKGNTPLTPHNNSLVFYTFSLKDKN
jgi:hypothetical protein